MLEDGALFPVDMSGIKSWVYLIGVPGQSIAKIGYATDVKARLVGLQTSHPHRLAVLWKARATRDFESVMHGHFAALRMEGEWFDFRGQDPAAVVRAAFGEGDDEEPALRQVSRIHHPEDPDRDNPAYQPDHCGCRSLTPFERVVAALGPNDARFFCACGLFETHC